jgi:hypothetical protein
MCFCSVISTNFFNFGGKTRQNLDITNVKKTHWIWPLEWWVQYTWHDVLALNKILVKNIISEYKISNVEVNLWSKYGNQIASQICWYPSS